MTVYAAVILSARRCYLNWLHDRSSAATVKKVHGTDVDRLWPNESAVAQLFEAMRRPTEDSSDSERRREEFCWQFQTVEQQRRVELDVGVEPAIGLVLAQKPKRRDLDRSREIVERAIAVSGVETLGG